ncbi:MAG: ATP-binding protein [Deltaproteobacteria bacterium]|jgi:hypothetical protein|nr:ATP-binding protein [Deltaproteobacteria bacterium]
MTQDIPSLPAGQQVFENIRLKNFVYVDKTKYLPMLLETGKFIFCSRPRRFGKSLTIHALDSFYSGKTTLFEGLAAEKNITSPSFVPHPVIRLNMSEADNSDSKNILEANIVDILSENAERHNVTLRGANHSNTFLSLIKDIHKATGTTVVILIDEYDAPVISLVQREESEYDEHLIRQTRTSMQSFYSKIKAADEHIEFVFITGVTKFSKMGVFSSLNNLIDISIMPKYAEFMGYSQTELESYFSYFISETAKDLQMSEPELLKKIEDYYDGFSFDGNKKVYNPFSTLSFFINAKFLHYWMESGSNSLIRKFLRDKSIVADQFEGMVVKDLFASSPGDIQSASPEGFLYQAGYLTLRSISPDRYKLEYPNFEVRQAISSLFLENLYSSRAAVDKTGEELEKRLAARDVPGMVRVFMRLLYGICYDDHSAAEKGPREEDIVLDIRNAFDLKLTDVEIRRRSAELVEKILREKGEGFYRSVLQASLWTAGAKTTPEKHESIGRLDIEVVYGAMTYVIELKMADDVNGGPAAARAGMDQIRTQVYGLASKNPIRISIAIGRKERNIVACLFEMDGREMCVTPDQVEIGNVGNRRFAETTSSK